jgi:phage terminase small subunit
MAEIAPEDVPLNARQQRFVEEYCAHFNGTRAAIAAGYSKRSAREIASENLTKPNIARAVKERLDSLVMSAEEATRRLEEMAKADLEPFFVEKEIERDGEVIKYMALDLTTEQAKANFHKIKAIVPTQSGTKIVLHDQQSALETILKVHGKLVNRMDVTSKDEKIETIQLMEVRNGSSDDEAHADTDKATQ